MAYAAHNVPRYTSYPTAPHFSEAVGAKQYGSWLDSVAPEATISLYLHIPFCRSICHYCGCHTKAALRDQPVTEYAARLARELDIVLRHIGPGRRLVHLHWGGGTPNILPEGEFLELVDRIHDGFALSERLEHAIELDPRTVTPRLAALLVQAGITRVNLGVQDFNPEVQLAIGRWQPYGQVVEAVSHLRAAGIDRIGFDLMYGLPHQGEREIVLNAARAAGLWPQRLAVFGYAHVPWMKKHQRRIDAAALPGAVERVRQAETIGRTLLGAGYRRIGLDHFALPGDDLAAAADNGRLRRNFQGYTADPADILVGIGASAISRLPQGYVQNAVDLGGWGRKIGSGQLPTARGRGLSPEDRLRAEIIEGLMCQFETDLEGACRRHGLPRESLDDAEKALAPLVRDGLARSTGGKLRIPEAARPFARVVAAAFDGYLAPAADRHSAAV